MGYEYLRNESIIRSKTREFFGVGTVVTASAYLVSVVDFMLIGALLGADAVAAAGLCDSFVDVAELFGFVLSSGGPVAAGILLGKRRLRQANGVFTLSLLLTLAGGLLCWCLLPFCGFFSGVLFFAISQLAPAGVLGLFTRDTDVIAEGVRYLKVICWTYPVFGLSNSLMYALQSVETAMIGTVMSCSTICINVCLNYCLIYGNFGAPELGIVGAAVATLVSRLVELGIILVYILFLDKKLHMKLWELLRWDGTYLQDYLKVSTPIVISGLLWGVAQAAQTAIPGHMSATAIAANSIAIILFEIFAVLGAACANTASVVTGKTIGAGKLDKVKAYSKTMQGIFLLGGLFSGGMLFWCKDWIVNFYTVSPAVKAMAVDFMTVLSVASIGSCYEYPVEGGIIAGGGSTKYAAVVDNLFMWLFTIPSAALSAFVFQFPPVVTFAFLKADQILKCIPNCITCNRYRWVKRLTRGDSN